MIDQRHAGAVAFDIGERALELALEAAAVEDVGQRIDVDPRLELADAGARGFKLGCERIDFGGEPHRGGAGSARARFGSNVSSRLPLRRPRGFGPGGAGAGFARLRRPAYSCPRSFPGASTHSCMRRALGRAESGKIGHYYKYLMPCDRLPQMASPLPAVVHAAARKESGAFVGRITAAVKARP